MERGIAEASPCKIVLVRLFTEASMSSGVLRGGRVVLISSEPMNRNKSQTFFSYRDTQQGSVISYGKVLV